MTFTSSNHSATNREQAQAAADPSAANRQTQSVLLAHAGPLPAPSAKAEPRRRPAQLHAASRPAATPLTPVAHRPTQLRHRMRKLDSVRRLLSFAPGTSRTSRCVTCPARLGDTTASIGPYSGIRPPDPTDRPQEAQNLQRVSSSAITVSPSSILLFTEPFTPRAHETLRPFRGAITFVRPFQRRNDQQYRPPKSLPAGWRKPPETVVTESTTLEPIVSSLAW